MTDLTPTFGIVSGPLRRVRTDADAHEGLIRVNVVDAIRDRLAFVFVRKVVCLDFARETARRSGWFLPSCVLRLPCRLNPSPFKNRRTEVAEAKCRWRRNWAANCRVDLQVQRNGLIGSPRVSGSTSAIPRYSGGEGLG